MSNTVTVSAILHTTALELLDSLSNVRGDGAELRVRHQTAGAENLAQTTDLAHLVRSSNSSVEVELASLDLSSQLVGTDDVSTSLTSSVGCSALGENSNTDSLTRAVRQGDRATQLLISLTGVDTQAEVSLDGLIELGSGDFLHHCKRLKRSVDGIADLLDGSAVSLGMLCHDSSFRGS